MLLEFPSSFSSSVCKLRLVLLQMFVFDSHKLMEITVSVCQNNLQASFIKKKKRKDVFKAFDVGL